MAHYLDEQKADESLEKVLEIVEDDVLKAKSSDEKKQAVDNYVKISNVCNERIKIQNDKCVSDDKIALDTEKMENDIEHQEALEREERKARNRERLGDFLIKGLKVGLVVAGFVCEAIMVHENIIKTDDMSKAASRNTFGAMGNYLKD